MPYRTKLIPSIIVCLLIASVFFIGSLTGILGSFTSLIQIIFQPFQKAIFSLNNNISTNNSPQTELLNLQSQLIIQKEVASDNKALRDQFATSTPISKNLLPSTIIGSPHFLPGVTKPEVLIIDKGSNDNVQTGQSVVYKNNLIGRISAIYGKESVVQLITNKDVIFPVKTLDSNALGISRGQGNGELFLDNVVLSDILKKGDIVVTKGDKDVKGNGYEPGLVVGKIVAVNKKASNIFQSADVASLIDISKISMVFIEIQ